MAATAFFAAGIAGLADVIDLPALDPGGGVLPNALGPVVKAISCFVLGVALLLGAAADLRGPRRPLNIGSSLVGVVAILLIGLAERPDTAFGLVAIGAGLMMLIGAALARRSAVALRFGAVLGAAVSVSIGASALLVGSGGA